MHCCKSPYFHGKTHSKPIWKPVCGAQVAGSRLCTGFISQSSYIRRVGPGDEPPPPERSPFRALEASTRKSEPLGSCPVRHVRAPGIELARIERWAPRQLW